MAAAAESPAAEPSCGSSSSAAPMRTRSVVPERESGVSVVVAAVAAVSAAEPVASAAEPDYMKEYRSKLCKRSTM
uniref:Uncharacterized protein n=1 Tax=Oryza rufipogon TaxID=4529 RepID=A0A0E0NPV0_ORYRU